MAGFEDGLAVADDAEVVDEARTRIRVVVVAHPRANGLAGNSEKGY